MADAGEVLMGPIGREIFGFGQILFLVFLMGSHVLTFTVAMNTVTGHATCSIVFGVVGMAVSCILSIPRTLSGMTWLALACKSNLPMPFVFQMYTNRTISFYKYFKFGSHNDDCTRCQ